MTSVLASMSDARDIPSEMPSATTCQRAIFPRQSSAKSPGMALASAIARPVEGWFGMLDPFTNRMLAMLTRPDLQRMRDQENSSSSMAN